MMQRSQVVETKYPLKCCNTKEGKQYSRSRIRHTVMIPHPAEKENAMVEDFLREGKENAIPSKQLADLAGCKSVRELQEKIADERAAGAVILSTCENGGGYFLPDPENVGEVKEFIRTLENRGKNTLLALKSARDYLNRCGIDGE